MLSSLKTRNEELLNKSLASQDRVRVATKFTGQLIHYEKLFFLSHHSLVCQHICIYLCSTGLRSLHFSLNLSGFIQNPRQTVFHWNRSQQQTATWPVEREADVSGAQALSPFSTVVNVTLSVPLTSVSS